jgi:hypothetical protein
MSRGHLYNILNLFLTKNHTSYTTAAAAATTTTTTTTTTTITIHFSMRKSCNWFYSIHANCINIKNKSGNKTG